MLTDNIINFKYSDYAYNYTTYAFMFHKKINFKFSLAIPIMS